MATKKIKLMLYIWVFSHVVNTIIPILSVGYISSILPYKSPFKNALYFNWSRVIKSSQTNSNKNKVQYSYGALFVKQLKTVRLYDHRPDHTWKELTTDHAQTVCWTFRHEYHTNRVTYIIMHVVQKKNSSEILKRSLHIF